MDVLGDVLLSLRLLAGRIGIIDLGGPWGLSCPPHPPHHVVGLTVIDGPLWLELDGGPPTRLLAGDTVLVLSGVAYKSRSDPTAPTVEFADFVTSLGLARLTIGNLHEDPLEIRWGEGVERTRLLHIALIAQDDGPSAILAQLPRALIIRPDPDRRPAWLDAAVAFLASESLAKPGYTAAATRQVELIFTSLLREHLLAGEFSGPNWVSGLRDPRVGRAVAGIHSRPDAPWTVESLAREAGMARSSFARRFVELIGQSPIDYLISHRMQLAYGRMAGDKQPVSAVAEGLGYRSERAFRQAFKAHFGMAPTQYLKRSVESI